MCTRSQTVEKDAYSDGLDLGAIDALDGEVDRVGERERLLGEQPKVVCPSDRVAREESSSIMSQLHSIDPSY